VATNNSRQELGQSQPRVRLKTAFLYGIYFALYVGPWLAAGGFIHALTSSSASVDAKSATVAHAMSVVASLRQVDARETNSPLESTGSAPAVGLGEIVRITVPPVDE